MLLTAVTIVFLAGYGGLIFFYHRHWRRLQDYFPAAATPSVYVSVVIAARNEEDTLPQLVADLKTQRYPSRLWEAIIVNDYSTDGTATLASALPANVRMMRPSVPAAQSSKKKAIESGIKEAKGSLLLITDADCRVSPGWIQTAASFYEERQSSFIAAPVRFTHNNTLLQTFQALDFTVLQGITAASVSSGFHTMCNGANLAYTKEAFQNANGFDGIDNVATGDDMLLMHKIWKRQPETVFYLKSKEAIVSTEPMKTWRQFFGQRKRWASKTLVYDDWRIIAVLFFVLLFNALFVALLVTAFLAPFYFVHAALLLIIKTAIEWPFVSSVAAFFNQQKLMRWFPLFQPLHIFYTVFVGLLSQFGKYEWKGRRTR